MKLRTDVMLPDYMGTDPFMRRLMQSLTDRLREAAVKVNGLASGRVSALENTYTAAPAGGDWTQGDMVTNSAPAELGSAGSKYVILGWVCVASGSPGTWKECRCLTGG